MDLIFELLLAFIIGSFVTFIGYYISPKDGVLRIDTENSEKDIYRIEIDDLDQIKAKSYIRLGIDPNWNSREESNRSYDERRIKDEK